MGIFIRRHHAPINKNKTDPPQANNKESYMIEVKKEGILLEKTNLEFENEGVLNPAVIRIGDSVHILYRAVQQGNHSTIGYCKLDGPLTLTERWDKPIIVPESEYE